MAQPTRRALLIGTARYQDAALPDLAGATTDTTTLAQVLRDERIGGFMVRTVLDRSAHEIAREIDDLVGACSPRDLVLLYFTGHGIKGPDGRLYFAAANTNTLLLRSSAISAAWILDALDACRSRRQMVLLDCCHSGAFTQGTKAGEQVGSTEQLQGRGRVILRPRTPSSSLWSVRQGINSSSRSSRPASHEDCEQGTRTSMAMGW